MKSVRACFYSLIAMLIMASGLSAQAPLTVDLGVRGGAFIKSPPIEAPSNDNFPPNYSNDRKLLSVGPSLEAMLYDRVAIRLEAVRSQFRFHGASRTGPNSATWTTTGNLWQFPLLATYAFGSGGTRAFAGGGLGLSTKLEGRTTGSETVDLPRSPRTTRPLDGRYLTFSHPTTYYISGGILTRTSLLTIRPELRYARWSRFSNQESQTLNSRNQIEFVIGVSVRVFSLGSMD